VVKCLVTTVNDPLSLTFIYDPTLRSPLVANHHVRPAPQCSKLTVMTVATSFHRSHYMSICSSSFSKLR